MPLLNVLGFGIQKVLGIVNKKVQDKDLSLQLKNELATLQIDLQSQALEYEQAKLEAKAAIVLAEARSESFLTANWRPLAMVAFVILMVLQVVWNNIYIPLFDPDFPPVILPGYIEECFKIGLGGYVVGRSAEKVAKNWKNGI